MQTVASATECPVPQALTDLIYIYNVGTSIPAPVSCLRTELASSELHNFAGAILLKHPNHAARGRTAVEPES
jgi:hypothetical protein